MVTIPHPRATEPPVLCLGFAPPVVAVVEGTEAGPVGATRKPVFVFWPSRRHRGRPITASSPRRADGGTTARFRGASPVTLPSRNKRQTPRWVQGALQYSEHAGVHHPSAHTHALSEHAQQTLSRSGVPRGRSPQRAGREGGGGVSATRPLGGVRFQGRKCTRVPRRVPASGWPQPPLMNASRATPTALTGRVAIHGKSGKRSSRSVLLNRSQTPVSDHVL